MTIQLITLADAERRHIESVLAHTGGVVEGADGAARILDMHPNTLRSRMKKLGIVFGRYEIRSHSARRRCRHDIS